jgi:acyl phosphate:glycerol-3-phosphate acyltransferase
MDQTLQLVVAIVASYVVGSAIGGYYLTRWRVGVDIRETGSGSAGARNTTRYLGRAFGVLAFLWDLAKGVAVAFLAQFYFQTDLAVALCAVAVVIGHVWPASLRFRGGKGVATTAGVMLVWQPEILVALALVYVVLGRSGSVSRRALIAFAAGLAAIPVLGIAGAKAVFCGLLLLVLVWTHRDGFSSSCRKVMPS